jgi:ADP-heptose:LPS heptosyltransferase
MTKVLIYRTDRIGDLIYTCPLIITIKKSLNNPKITLIGSEKNFNYAKNLGIFHEILTIPKNVFKKINFFYSMWRKSFDYVFVLDGKERSILSASLVKSKKKIAITYKWFFYYKFFNIKFIEDTQEKELKVTFQELLNSFVVNYKISNYDFLKVKKDTNFSLNIPVKRYIQIHLDEKWINNLYIESYTDINPNYLNFTNFLDEISKKNNVLISTGLESFDLINKLKEVYFTKKNEHLFFKKNSLNSIYLVNKPSFENLESLLRKANILISCHGAITHAANSFDIKKIDIFEKKRKDFYKKYTSYMNNYYPIYRKNFNDLKNEIFKNII